MRKAHKQGQESPKKSCKQKEEGTSPVQLYEGFLSEIGHPLKVWKMRIGSGMDAHQEYEGVCFWEKKPVHLTFGRTSITDHHLYLKGN